MNKDHFSRQARAYRDFRPSYPAALFDWIAATVPGRALAWDCGCGSGQATLDLAGRFARVIATDMSAKQLEQAERRDNIDYRCEGVEHSSLDDASADAILIAQALHWFDHDAFNAELRRVARPGALAVALTYNLLQVSPAVDAILDDFYWKTLKGWWPAGREHVEDGYRHIPFPFARVETPGFALGAHWNLAQLRGYLYSWSAVAAYQAKNGSDPLQQVDDALSKAWGDADTVRPIAWPLTLLAGRVNV